VKQFIAFIVRGFAEHGVKKLVPDLGTIETHARRLIEQKLACEALAEVQGRITRQAKCAAGGAQSSIAKLPGAASSRPCWDEVPAQIIGDQNGRDVMG
jgi:hypothetical protein